MKKALICFLVFITLWSGVSCTDVRVDSKTRIGVEIEQDVIVKSFSILSNPFSSKDDFEEQEGVYRNFIRRTDIEIVKIMYFHETWKDEYLVYYKIVK